MKDFFQLPAPSYTFEIFPPKGSTDLAGTYATVDALASLTPDLISVTYGAGGTSRDNTLDIASTIQNRYDICGLAHLTCVGSTKENIAGILDELQANHVGNILALRGDLKEPSELGEFRHASDLIAFIRKRRGFRIFAACYPEKHLEAPSPEEDLCRLKEKSDLGVDALISQLFFDNDVFCRFRDRARALGVTVPIIAGIMPITSAAQIDKMVTMCGATVPDRVRRFVDAYGHNSRAIKEAGIAYATEQIVDLLARGVDGIHLYTMNQADVIRHIDENIRGILYSMRVKKD
ncbi:methylenetetrahydrofolate reductase [NAD(P)H] [uncultured Fretibacterium sp.]|uniref:methylenetetrahydrofolate reductase [NAD(P)H] n=1 Tax=uncultured Fretibacterium sp. TaxID=1678694 RepID=UPI0026373851|nr:methylenetetrahydrofolate reductase [NAD(P)H] [uncultured Fretibacterium sp.]